MPDESSPHDRLVREIFGSPEHMADALRGALPPRLARRIDWSTLRREPGTFVDRRGESRTDLLFSARIGERRLLLYFLFEHQSTPDADMPLRVAIAYPKVPPRYGSRADGRKVAIEAMRLWETEIQKQLPWFRLEFVVNARRPER